MTGVNIQSPKEASFFPVTKIVITRNVEHDNMVSPGGKFYVVIGVWCIQISYWLKFSDFLTGFHAHSLKSYAPERSPRISSKHVSFRDFKGED